MRHIHIKIHTVLKRVSLPPSWQDTLRTRQTPGSASANELTAPALPDSTPYLIRWICWVWYLYFRRSSSAQIKNDGVASPEKTGTGQVLRCFVPPVYTRPLPRTFAVFGARGPAPTTADNKLCRSSWCLLYVHTTWPVSPATPRNLPTANR